ncbi:RnfABCDGE type electron transport complex subunit B [bacterium]|nr:RnfABCDGE type electron transport complex subunit B [bacterium]MBU1599966.1 RnfABCDGE type electron transport complex subunit B [bacterium]
MIESGLMLGGIGGFFALLLFGAGRLFYHEEDPRVNGILELLPGSSCGACGFAGCKGYAEAVVKDIGCASNLCRLAGESATKEIGKLTGKEAPVGDRHCVAILCNPKREPLFSYNGPGTCESANLLFSGQYPCSYSCLKFFDCVKGCPFSAIFIRDGRIEINKEACKGCGVCINLCPKGLLALIPEMARVVVLCSSKDKPQVTKGACDNGCIGCKKCEKECPEGAITVESFLARIDYAKCTSCIRCVSVCDQGTIVAKLLSSDDKLQAQCVSVCDQGTIVAL